MTSSTHIRRSPATKLQSKLKHRILQGNYLPNSYLPSQRSLADDFGISRPSVSKALEALEREGMVIRTQGRGTRVLPVQDKGLKLKIGVIFNEPAMSGIHERRDTWMAFKGATEMLNRRGCGYQLVLHDEEAQDHVPDSTLDKFQALLAFEAVYLSSEQLVEMARRKIPMAIAKFETSDDPAGIDVTCVDRREAMRQAVCTCHQMGHRRIAFVGRDIACGAHGEAQHGYRQGLVDAGIDADDSLVVICEKTNGLSAYFTVKPILHCENPPTAILTDRDCLAEGVYHAIEEAGLILGQQISLIGFDDTTWPDGRAFLTTFREDSYAMGAAAADMLINRISDPDKPQERRIFETPLILRRTAGPLVESNPVGGGQLV